MNKNISMHQNISKQTGKRGDPKNNIEKPEEQSAQQ
jgi:hypothetical protein